ncbi:MAG: gephyrin-like molybdotransferase Glp [Gammaproteobacteria bacterium]
MNQQPPANQAATCMDARDPNALSVEQACQSILDRVKPVSGERRVAIREGLGRILARPVISSMQVPGHTNSAVDGFAINADALKDDGTAGDFEVIGTAMAGTPCNEQVTGRNCIRIMTGAVMPAGADTVIMREHCEEMASDSVRVNGSHKRGQNVRHAGEDIAIGDTVFAPGHMIKAADLGVMASLGVAELWVHRRPRVAFFSTGDELRGVGETLAEGEIYDSNRYSLWGMLSRLGVECVDLGVIRDQPDALRAALLEAAAEADAVITSGGVSVGDADYIKPVLDSLGQMDFWKIAMKPGRPLTFGQIEEALFFGLPGNPVAVTVTFYQFVLPALQALAGRKGYAPLMAPARVSRALRKKPGRTEYLRAVYHQENSQLHVDTTGAQGSGILTSMSRANCFIVLDQEQGDVAEGDTVLIQPFDALV